ncbi:hypothetical protein CRM22_001022 [Opisthorchis felineus]|uniref:Uncharacterized protein n=1 Tax=Opisthorchis felineus TaxID=147828 RepID=A0A4V3SH00_OPIFE|nr:hypothetical protein CRM22_001022 [Opisthorchis felineus]
MQNSKRPSHLTKSWLEPNGKIPKLQPSTKTPYLFPPTAAFALEYHQQLVEGTKLNTSTALFRPLNPLLSAATFWTALEEQLKQQQRSLCLTVPNAVTSPNRLKPYDISSRSRIFDSSLTSPLVSRWTATDDPVSLMSRQQNTSNPSLSVEIDNENLRSRYPFVCPMCKERIESNDLETHFNFELEKFRLESDEGTKGQCHQQQSTDCAKSPPLMLDTLDELESQARYEKFLTVKQHRRQRQEMLSRMRLATDSSIRQDGFNQK